jgi:hypothetical protein
MALIPCRCLAEAIALLGASVACYIGGGKAPPVAHTSEGERVGRERSTTPSLSRVHVRKTYRGFGREPTSNNINTYTRAPK